MVRLEKIAYEQLVNSQVLKRSRQLGAPSKWYKESRHQVQKVSAYKIFCTGLTSVFARFVEPVLSKLTYQRTRDYCGQRGWAQEDVYLFQERQLRRCVLFENMMRQGFHPYQWIFFKARRQRFYKVERSLRGFFVPEYLKKEGMDRLLSDTLENKEVFEEYVHQNYMSDMTPTTRQSVIPRYIPLEMFNLYGWFRTEAWDRLFFNEVYYDDDKYTDADYKNAEKPFNQNINTESGRATFEYEVNRFISLYPGSVVQDGEKFNFQEYYAREALSNEQDTSQFDQQQISQIKYELNNYIDHQVDDVQKEIGTSYSQKIGGLVPEFMRPKSGRGFH